MKKMSLFMLIVTNVFSVFADYGYYYSPEMVKQLAYLLSCLQYEDIAFIIHTTTKDMPPDEFENVVGPHFRDMPNEIARQLFAITPEPKDIMCGLLEDIQRWYAVKDINFYERFDRYFRYFLYQQDEEFLTHLVRTAEGRVSFQFLLRMIVSPSWETSNLEKYLITRFFEKLPLKIQFVAIIEIRELIGEEDYCTICKTCRNLEELLKKLDAWFLKSGNRLFYKTNVLSATTQRFKPISSSSREAI